MDVSLKHIIVALSTISALFIVFHYNLALKTDISYYRHLNFLYLNSQAFFKTTTQRKRNITTVAQCRRRLIAEAITKPSSEMRDFDYNSPVRIVGHEINSLINMTACAVPCLHQPGRPLPVDLEAKADATFDKIGDNEKMIHNILTVYRTMEAVGYKPLGSYKLANRKFDVVMTPALRSDVPAPYFSWVTFDFMKPVSEKVSPFLATAMISNCMGRSFRLESVNLLMKQLKVDYRGKCSYIVRERDRSMKGAVIRQSKFHLAFENTQEEDYVTEKFFESISEGTVPVVIGSPNIYDFAPSNNSILVINSLNETEAIGKQMLQLAKDDKAYDAMLAWKDTGPSYSFKALVDLAVVHSSCRLCIHVADTIQQREQCEYFDSDDACYLTNEKIRNDVFFKKLLTIDNFKAHDVNANKTSLEKACSCFVDEELSDPFEMLLLRVRERGKFEFFNIFLESNALTVDKLHHEVLTVFSSISPPYLPIWTAERDGKGRQKMANLRKMNFRKNQSDKAANSTSDISIFKIYRIYPLGVTQRAALFEDVNIDSDKKLKNFATKVPCGRLEVIFV